MTTPTKPVLSVCPIQEHDGRRPLEHACCRRLAEAEQKHDEERNRGDYYSARLDEQYARAEKAEAERDEAKRLMHHNVERAEKAEAERDSLAKEVARLKLTVSRRDATQSLDIDQIDGLRRENEELREANIKLQDTLVLRSDQVTELQRRLTTQTAFAEVAHRLFDTYGEDLEERLASVEALTARVAELEAQLACDACDGSGTALSGPCGCKGRGVVGMLESVRLAKFDISAKHARLVDAAHGVVAALKESRVAVCEVDDAVDEAMDKLDEALLGVLAEDAASDPEAKLCNCSEWLSLGGYPDECEQCGAGRPEPTESTPPRNSPRRALPDKGEAHLGGSAVPVQVGGVDQSKSGEGLQGATSSAQPAAYPSPSSSSSEECPECGVCGGKGRTLGRNGARYFCWYCCGTGKRTGEE